MALFLWKSRKLRHRNIFRPNFTQPNWAGDFGMLFPLRLFYPGGAGFSWRRIVSAGKLTMRLAYRTPRVLHWLAAGHWYWIHTEFERLNTRTAGFEWVTAPLLLFSGTDRSGLSGEHHLLPAAAGAHLRDTDTVGCATAHNGLVLDVAFSGAATAICCRRAAW